LGPELSLSRNPRGSGSVSAIVCHHYITVAMAIGVCVWKNLFPSVLPTVLPPNPNPRAAVLISNPSAWLVRFPGLRRRCRGFTFQ